MVRQLRTDLADPVALERFHSLNLAVPHALRDPDQPLVEQEIAHRKCTDFAATYTRLRKNPEVCLLMLCGPFDKSLHFV